MGVQIPTREGTILRVQPALDMPVQCGCQLGCTKQGAHWRLLANTIKPSVWSGNAALCQITLTVIIIVKTVWCVYILQLNQLKLELDNAIHAHKWPSNSCLVTKACVPSGAASSQQHAHRISVKPTTKKSYVFLIIWISFYWWYGDGVGN